MEKEERNIFYMAIVEGGRGKKRDLFDGGLPVKRVGRSFPYLSWQGRTVTSGLRIYFALMPQYEKRLFGERAWRAKTADRILGKTMDKAEQAYGCREWIWAPGLLAEKGELPVELWAACLYMQRPFDRICLSMQEDGEYYGEQAFWLIRPYLPRMKMAYYYGAESENSFRMKEALADEFGLILTEVSRPDPGIVWLDLRRGAVKEEMTSENREQGKDKTAKKQTKYVNENLVWNFLDTTVKNGYNTEVN